MKVPSKAYQIKTEHLKEGVVAINFSESKNFEPNVKDKVRPLCSSPARAHADLALARSKASLYCPGIGKATIVLLQRNLLRLRSYQDMLAAKP
jgi:methylenetetrahydrofolate dehydrogenase (NAD+)